VVYFYPKIFYHALPGFSPPPEQFPRVSPSFLETPASLYLEPQGKTVVAEHTFRVDIFLDAGTAEVDAVDAILTFNPEIFSAEKLETGDFFNMYPVVSTQSGKVQITALVSPKEGKPQTVSGQGRLGSVLLKALTSGEAKVEFSPDCVVAEKGRNILGETTGGSYTILWEKF
jgi:hypothetical protein